MSSYFEMKANVKDMWKVWSKLVI